MMANAKAPCFSFQSFFMKYKKRIFTAITFAKPPAHFSRFNSFRYGCRH